jgi:squalene synthase HpnC
MTTAHHGKAFHGGEHYENFPVGSWLVPKAIREPILRLYRFARTGDDLADEGDLDRDARVAGLNALRDGLNARPNTVDPYLHAIGSRLSEALQRHRVPTHWADDLIHAFLQDVNHAPMASEEEVLRYCQYSAAPVGRLVLGLSGLLDQDGEPGRLKALSDAICCGLQLANFAQDMGQDLSRRRTYLPMAWWPAGWSPDLGIAGLRQTDRQELPSRMASWALALLGQGDQLPRAIRQSDCLGNWRLAMEIAITVEGGREICRQVLANPEQVWSTSPVLSKFRLAMVVFRAIRLL